MRFVGDFFTGIRSGLGYARAATFRTPAGLRPKAPRISKPGHPVVSVLLRATMLMLAVGLGAAALFTFSGPKVMPHRFVPQLHPGTSQTIPDEVLATDPDVPVREWKYIVLHHSASAGGNAEIFDHWHRENNHWKNGLGYDFVIGNGQGQGDGEIVAGPRWYSQEPGAHANSREYNEHGIGICLVGNFETSLPTLAQSVALQLLVNRLCRTYRITSDNVVGHNQIRQGGTTACPGRLFPLMRIRADISDN